MLTTDGIVFWAALTTGVNALVGTRGSARLKRQQLGNRDDRNQPPGSPECGLSRSVEHGGGCRRRCDSGLAASTGGCATPRAGTLLLDRKCRTKPLTGIINTVTDCPDCHAGRYRRSLLPRGTVAAAKANDPEFWRDAERHSPFRQKGPTARKKPHRRGWPGVPTVVRHSRKGRGLGWPKLHLCGDRLDPIGQEDGARGHRMESRIFGRFRHWLVCRGLGTRGFRAGSPHV